MVKRLVPGFLAVLVLSVVVGVMSVNRGDLARERSSSFRLLNGKSLHPIERYGMVGLDMAADCALEPTGENYTGVRYKAYLAEDELSETGWTLLFAGSGFTANGEYQPHFVDLMIIGGGNSLYDDPNCSNGWPPFKGRVPGFTIQFGLSDYEDGQPGFVHDNDIGALSRDPLLFPRMFTNIDSTSPEAPDKLMTEYQVDRGGALDGREIEVSLVREEETTLPRSGNYFMDPDYGGTLLCKPNSQDDILYRHWVARLVVPSLGIDSSVDFYVNASQASKITGDNTLDFMWENPGRPSVESDRYRVILYDMAVRTESGVWRPATRFLVDYRTPLSELPLDGSGKLLEGYRKVNYKGRAAIEASFGYGYTDYVRDGDLTDYERSNATKGVIDLRTPAPGGELVYIPMILKVQASTSQGSVLFDEAHSEWVSIEGSYREFANRLRARGYTVDRVTTSPITLQKLTGYDVYVVGTPWGTFTQSEIDAIRQFVQGGGGLFLTGLGWSWVDPQQGRTLDNYPPNLIGAPFGIRFLDDAICDPDSHFGTDNCTPIFVPQCCHWVLAGVDQLGGPICPAPITGTQATAFPLLYGGARSYSNGGRYQAGTYPPVAMVSLYGSGRVLALGHEGYLGTDDYNNDGTPNLYDCDNLAFGLNVIDWLATRSAQAVGGYRLKRVIDGVAGQSFLGPSALALDDSGNVYMSDGDANKVLKFSHSGDFLMQVAPGTGTEPGKLFAPAGLAVDTLGRIFVAELGNHRVSVFSPSGQFLYAFGQQGSAPGQLNQPLGLDIAPDGNLYVAEWYNGRIQKFSPTGTFLGQVNSRYVYFQWIDVDSRGYVYASDPFAPEVFRFRPDGNLGLSFGSAGTGDGQFGEPRGVAADQCGNIFVTDSVRNRVQVFDPSGRFLLKFGESGSGPGQFSDMSGIRVAPDGLVYVVATKRLHIFEPIR